MKTHFTRKNFIAIGLVFFYAMFGFIAALLIDSTNPLGIKASMNLVRNVGLAIGFPAFNGSAGAWVLVSLILIYVVFFAAAFIFEMRLAKYYGEKPNSKKWIGIYAATFLASFALAFGIGMVAQYPYQGEYIVNSILFLIEALFMGFLMFLVALMFVGAICMIVVNFKNIDKPFRYFGKKAQTEEALEAQADVESVERLDEMGHLAESFGEVGGQSLLGATIQGSSLAAGSAPQGALDESPLGEKERVFPGLCTIDVVEEARRDLPFEDDVDLATLCSKFRNYLAKEEKLYFSIDTIRAFVSGMAASRLIILEGLSGTGKSSLARYFSEFIGEESFFEAVQATWRDRTSILGYFNDFSKTYNETEFLKRLYQANYREHHVNVMVLDEINISRVEYYFADFLSILEYPQDKWALKVLQLPYDFEAPSKLPDGVLRIPANTWFIGTANKDDSTYTITDKVYDRAITISFDDRNEEFQAEGGEKITLSYDCLADLFAKAVAVKENNLSAGEKKTFKKLTDFAYEKFDVTFGNRILRQIEILVPVYVACGGSKEDALDFLFSRKIVAKLSGRFEDSIKQGLIDLKSLINKVYGESSFALSKAEIDKLLRKL